MADFRALRGASAVMCYDLWYNVILNWRILGWICLIVHCLVSIAMSFNSSVFSGTAIVCNFVLMVTWTPSIFVFYQKFFASSTCSSMLPPHMKSPLKSTAKESQTKEDDNKAIPSITNSSKHILRYFCSFNWIRLLSQKALSLLFWKNKLENWIKACLHVLVLQWCHLW